MDKWDDYDWSDSSRMVLGVIPDDNKLQGYMPNKLDILIPILYTEKEGDKELYKLNLYFSGVRCIASKQK